MDTPERSKVAGTPISKFEDSPVFNFINNLSPIQPVKPPDSLHIAQTYQSLNFASLSSIFSSPHVNPLREARFLGKVPFTNSLKEDNSSDNVSESNLSSEVSDVVRPSRFTTSAQENCIITCSLNEATVDPPDQCPTLAGTFPQSNQYDSGSPDHNTTPCYGIKMDDKLYIDNTPVNLHFIQTGVEQRKILFATENGVQETHPLELTKNEALGLGCDWESLISDDDEGLLIFDSSTELEAQIVEAEKAVDNDGNIFVPLLTNCTENVDCLQKTQPDMSHGSCVHNVNNDPSTSCTEGCNIDHEADGPKNVTSGICQDQVGIHQQRGMLRRCLVFDLACVSKRNLAPSTSSSKGKSICGANNLKPKTSPSLCALPGIGLHLNALAMTSKAKVVKKDTPACGKQVINIPIDPFTSTITEKDNPTSSLSVGKDSGPEDNEGHLQIVPYDDTKDVTINNCEELAQGSPKKKRRKSQNGGDSEGCKRCNCKKSKCLKLYCECFAAGVYCSEPCSCQGCFNKPIHEETVLATRKQIESRNPLAFAPKVIRTSESCLEVRDDDNRTPASARHKRGCNCKKSNCLKKYCECYQGGVGCSIGCRCEGCKNLFGRKDGTLPNVEGIDQADKEPDECEKEDDKLEEGQQNTSIQIEHQAPGNILPATPLQSSRLSVEMPFYSSSKPPQPIRLSIGRSPALYGTHMIRKSELVILQSKLDNVTTIPQDDDTPAILKSTATSTTGLKVASPNGKRVSPPHNGAGLTPPNRKGCRKLILKSIPSFPSLSNEAEQ